MQTIIDSASTTFQTATGFSQASVITFMTDQLKLIVGSGLGILQSLMPLIVAIVSIGAIVYFAFRAFRFYRH